MPNLEIKQIEVFFSQEHQVVVAYKNDKPQTALAAQHCGKGTVHNDDAGDTMYNTLLKHARTILASVPVGN